MAQVLFVPKKTEWDCTYRWSFISGSDLHGKFHSAKFEEQFNSWSFDGPLETRWRFEVYPRGRHEKGSVNLYLKWLSKPDNLKKIELKREITCPEIGFEWNGVSQNYEEGDSWGWGSGILRYQDIPKKDSFSFHVSFKFTQAWDMNENEIDLKRSIGNGVTQNEGGGPGALERQMGKVKFDQIETLTKTVISRFDEIFDRFEKIESHLKMNEKKSDELGLAVIEWIVNDLKLPKEYANNLIGNGFEEMDTIMDLSDEDFKEMAGVEKKGHRMKIIKSLKKMKGKGEAEGMGGS